MSARDHAAVQRTYDYVNTWPEELQGAFWSAVNAGTYTQSAEKTLAFATALAHELAVKQRSERIRNPGTSEAALIDLIDPQVE